MHLTHATKCLLICLFVACSGWGLASGQEAGGESSEAAIAKYADAANFQTNGAMDLAIVGWQEFLQEYAKDPLAPKASHYLGVCFMQRDQPDYQAAADAFAKALQNKTYDLREESLANRGWCLYAASGQGVEPGEARDEQLLRQTISTFQQLAKEFPKSNFLDQAYFYSGEAAYAMGDAKQAIAAYDRLLKMPKAADSPLRCDALYARGVAQEELEDYDGALQAYRDLLASCSESDQELAQEVRVRVGDVLILKKDNVAAAEMFATAAQQGGENAAYAMFRRAFALAQAKQSAEAAKAYEQVISDYPQSRFAAAAILASAQSSYVAGDQETAKKRFQQVLARDNLAEATEAAHWLAQMAIRQGDVNAAEAVATQQIAKGVEGPYALALKLDQAEAMSMNPEKAAESLDLFAAVYREDPKSPLASRALYSAAFAALQAGNFQRAVDLSGEFLKRFDQDSLVNDVRYIGAEARLLAGKHADAGQAYSQLLTQAKDNPQRPMWVLRTATAFYLAGQYDTAIQVAERERQTLVDAAQRAEAEFLIGASQLFANRPEKAIESLQASRKQDPQWDKGDESLLLLGQAYQQAGDDEAAMTTWKSLAESYPDRRMADQAFFRLGQQAARGKDFDAAVDAYSQILTRKKDAGLVPYALFNKGWCLLQQEKFSEAEPLLKRMLDEYESHPLRSETQLAYGVTLRKMGQLEPAEKELQAMLDDKPQGNSLGHSLNELAQIKLKREQPAEAVPLLKRIVAEVPAYPALERVIYDLAWSLKESGDSTAAADYFSQLVARYPENPLAAEANYFIAEQKYVSQEWKAAATAFKKAAEGTEDPELAEKALYNEGWSLYRVAEYQPAEVAFVRQVKEHPEGKLAMDGLLMIGECRFKQGDFAKAVQGYEQARQRIEANGDNSETIKEPAQRQIRELVYLHGGQSLGQVNRWEESIQWFDELRSRFPTTQYLPQAFFQTAYAYQQVGNDDQALKLYGQVAGKYRDETAARSRFMMGEVYFAKRDMAKAIPEFQRVMYGFGAEKAPDEIKNWQAKSGFEAGRCAELLVQSTQGQPRENALKIARDFFTYVVTKHPAHELAPKSKERLEVLKRL